MSELRLRSVPAPNPLETRALETRPLETRPLGVRPAVTALPASLIGEVAAEGFGDPAIIPLWFGEVKEYLYPPQADADCKTFFFDFLVFFGIPFALVFFGFAGKLLTQLFRCQFYWLFVGVLLSVVALMTYYSTINAFTLPLLFGISLHEVRRLESSLRMH